MPIPITLVERAILNHDGTGQRQNSRAAYARPQSLPFEESLLQRIVRRIRSQGSQPPASTEAVWHSGRLLAGH